MGKGGKGGFFYGLFLFFIIVGLLSSCILAYVSIVHRSLRMHGFMVHALTILLLGFLLLLVIRYFFLLWFSFLSYVMREEPTAGWFPLVSVIVPAYNEEVTIQAVILSLMRLRYPRYEILVVDDGSTDGTFERAKRLEGEHGGVMVRVIRKIHGGKADALNQGIREAHGELVLDVDADSTLAPEALAAAVPHFADPSVGAVAGNVKVANRRSLLTWFQALEYVEGLNLVRRGQSFFGVVNIVPGPLGLFRREAILRAAGYSSDTFAEDCDMTLALLAQGWKVVYEPRAVAWTEAPERLLPLLKQRYRWTRGILQALLKRLEPRFFLRHDFLTSLTVASMIFEAVLWPAGNILANVFLVCVAVNFGFSPLLVLWWVQLTLLDVIGALYCVLAEKEDLRLIFYAVFYRVFFIFFVDIAKLLASIEELAGIQMQWGKLERLGRVS